MPCELGWKLAVGALICCVACARSEPREVAVASSALEPLPGFQDQVVVSGLEQPTAVRFASDGRIFIAEKSGLIKLFDPSRGEPPSVLADLRTQVYNYWDRGLLDLELHPDFPETPYLYVLYTHDAAIGGKAPLWGSPAATSDSCPTPPGATNQGCVVSGRLSRLEIGDNGLRGVEQVLIENWPQQYPSHSLGSIQFGPDGMLYVSGGDGASFDFVDYGQIGNPLGDPPVPAGEPQVPPAARGGALRAQNLALPGFSVTYNGKVLRVDPETGASAPGNPQTGAAAAVVAYGLRNPFRMTFRPGTRELWIGDVGWGGWEELDRLADPLAPALANFGWPCFEGPDRQAGYEATGLSVCTDLYARNDQRAPYFAYLHDAALLEGDGCGWGQAAVSGLAFYSDGLYPAEYRGALFLADYSRSCIWAMLPGADGLPDPATRRVFVHAAPQPVQLLIGPGNDLYYTSIAGALHRVAALGANQPPIAAFSAMPASGPVPLTAAFDASTSRDPDPGDTLTYAWDLDGDGVYDDATGPTAAYVYTTAGVRNVGLRVRDSRGAEAVAQQSVTAGENTGGPVATIVSAEPSQFAVGERVSFSGSGSDGIQPLPAASLHWDLVVQHCPVVDVCHPHVIESFEGVDSGSFIAPEHDYPYYLQLILRVTAPDGRQGTALERLDPRTVVLTLTATPPGLALALNQAVRPAPFSADAVVGSRNTVSAPAYAGYDFVAWSDGGAQAHVIQVSQEQQLTATYRVSERPAQLKALGAPIARVMQPMGGGNASLDVMRDGDYPTPGTIDSQRQYDTVTGDGGPKEDWFGYEFPASHAFTRVVFREGRNFFDGGWFERLGVRVRQNGVYRDVSALSIAPAYPGTSDAVGFRSYQLDFTGAVGDAIQIYGPAGGSAHFASVSELDVYGRRAIAGVPLAQIAPVPAVLLAGESVTLDARASFDPGGGALGYRWTQTAGSAVTLNTPTSVQPSFVAPSVTVPTALRFTLEVSGVSGSATSSIDVPITPLTAPVDISALGRPVISEPAPLGGGTYDLEVIRDGIEPAAGSIDFSQQYDTFAADPGVIEGWVGYEFDAPHRLGKLRFQEGGDFFDGGWFSALTVEVRQHGRWLPAPGLRVTPAYPAKGDGTGFQVYEFQFTPTLADGVRVFGAPGGSAHFFSVAELRAFAAPAPANVTPLADAGADAQVSGRITVSLDGTRSFDPDGTQLSYSWKQASGMHVQLSNPASAAPTFALPYVNAAAKLTFSLTVSDGVSQSAADTVTFTVNPVSAPEDLTPLGAPICSVRRSFGGGNHDLGVIRDGISPALDATDTLLQYDTFTGQLTGNGWIGYQLPAPRAFGRLVFQEGLHFIDGGWFGALDVQVRRGGVWSSVSGLAITPAYPGLNDGVSWQTYSLRFTPQIGEAIRISGPPGGDWTFFSVAELRAFTP
ncbi:MAG TPA: PQQ-dependent sugar dehydrogenase [Polyangiales bacterium]|nr:PQQ-dependent sugar dehydrogenase [Polyangiales bacterium]